MSEMDELLTHLQAMAAKWNKFMAESADKTPRQQYDEVQAIRLQLKDHPSVHSLERKVTEIKLRRRY